MANKARFSSIDKFALADISNYRVARLALNATTPDDKELRAELRKKMNSNTFAFLATADELRENGEKNMRRAAGRPTITGTAKTVPALFQTLTEDPNNDNAYADLVSEFISIFKRNGIDNANDVSVGKVIRAMLALVSATRYDTKTDTIKAKGARTLDTDVMNIFYHVCIKDNPAFDIAENGAITKHDFSKDNNLEEVA